MILSYGLLIRTDPKTIGFLIIRSAFFRSSLKFLDERLGILLKYVIIN